MAHPNRPSPFHLLLVEDNPADIMLTREVVRELDLNYQLHVVENGEVALQFLRREGKFAAAPEPHLVLLDLNLPRKDGREVLRAMRADESIPPIPVIVLTTSSHIDDVCLVYRLGANCFFTKPASLDEHFEMIQAIEQFWARVQLPHHC